MNRTIVYFTCALAGLPFASADCVAAHYKQGSMHGFLLVKSSGGKVVAVGELLQKITGSHVDSRLTFRFRDGSIDDDSTVFSQSGELRLISDHHVQKGASFEKPMDLMINVPTGEVTWRETKDGKTTVKTQHMDLPDDLVNGIIPTVAENLPANAKETTMSYLAGDPKPRLVKLSFRNQESDRFAVAGMKMPATQYTVHVELGGVAGVVAPLIGKQPADVHVWVLCDGVPSFVRMEGPFYQGGPIWSLELASPVWSPVKQ